MNSVELKNSVVACCRKQLQRNLEVVEQSVRQIEQSLFEETKSSAGDKHETGRAMVQLEREKEGRRLKEAETAINAFDKISYNAHHVKEQGAIRVGSLIHTSKGWYYIAVSLGIIETGGIRVFVVSPVSPIGKAMLGKTVGETAVFNNQHFEIKTVY